MVATASPYLSAGMTGYLASPSALMEAELGRRSLAEFMRMGWHVTDPATPLVWGPLNDAYCLHLEAVLQGRIQNLYIASPPGSSKSRTVNIFFPAWAWLTWPWLKFLCAAASQDLVMRDSVLCRRLIESDWYQERWGDTVKLTSDQNVKLWYENDRRGYRLSTTVGSKAVGKKGDILLIDDPHDTSQVESEVKRRGVIHWWDHSFYNRINDYKSARRIMIGQRTHFADLPAHVLAKGGFDILCLPEEFEPKTACRTRIGWQDWRTQDGEWLRPERFTEPQKTEAIAHFGTMGYASQHQQTPISATGGYFKKLWIDRTRYTRTADTFFLNGKGVHFKDCRWFATSDVAVSQKAKADWTVIMVWADDRRGNLMLAHVRRERLEGPDIVPAFKEAFDDWPLMFITMESVGFQLSTVQEAKRKGLVVKEKGRKKGEDKVTRAIPATVLWEQGQIWLPIDGGAPWLDTFVQELLQFDSGAHDDQVDCCSDAVDERNKLYQTTGKGPAVLSGGMGNAAPLSRAPAGSQLRVHTGGR